jgi:hypothetical protein
MKLAIVVQRYGADISGGAELHARYIAEHLSAHADVRVLTTCAHDYITWRNELPPGEQRVNGVVVERWPVSRERDRQWSISARQQAVSPTSCCDPARGASGPSMSIRHNSTGGFARMSAWFPLRSTSASSPRNTCRNF